MPTSGNSVSVAAVNELPSVTNDDTIYFDLSSHQIYIGDTPVANYSTGGGGGGGDAPSPSSVIPRPNGVGSAGSSLLYSRGDHVHPSDSSKLDSKSLTIGYVDPSTNRIYIPNTVPAQYQGASDYVGYFYFYVPGTLVDSETTNIEVTDIYKYTSTGTQELVAPIASVTFTHEGLYYGHVDDNVLTYTLVDTSGGGSNYAFSTVKVGSTDLVADAGADTLSIVAGSNITLVPTASTDSFTISATDTTYSSTSISIGSASLGADITADDITSWSAGSRPSLTITPTDVGTSITPTTGTAASATVSNGTLTIIDGSVPVTSVTLNTSSIGSASDWSAGSSPALSYTSRTIPNVSVTPVSVVTSVTAN